MRILAILALLILAAPAHALNGLEITRDADDRTVDSGFPACGADSVSSTQVVAAGTMVSVTWVQDTTDIVFYQGRGGDVYALANGSGRCATGTQARTATLQNCEYNPIHRRVDTLVSGSVVTSYGATSDVTSTIVSWCMYNRNKRATR